MITLRLLGKAKSGAGRPLTVLLDEMEIEAEEFVLRRGSESWHVADGQELSITADWEEVEVVVRGVGRERNG